MKKAKVMLMAIAVLAVVGGALAFKAKTFNGQKYCLLTTVGHVSGEKCQPIFITLSTTALGANKYYTTVAPIAVTTSTQCTTITCPGISTTFVPNL